MEVKKQQLEHQLSNPKVFGNPDALKEASTAFQETETGLDKLHKDWEQLVTELESLEKNHSTKN